MSADDVIRIIDHIVIYFVIGFLLYMMWTLK